MMFPTHSSEAHERDWLVVSRLALAVSSLLAWAALPLDAQEQTPSPDGTRSAVTDARWTPWLGCWRPDDDTLELEAEPDLPVLVCVGPADTAAGVVIRTFADQQAVFEETVAVDGRRYPLRDSGCEGWRLMEWSSTGRRVFTSAESTCSDQRVRRISGLTTITPDDRWVDIQTVTSGGRTTMRLLSYRRAPGSLPSPFAYPPWSPRPHVGPLTFDEVKEAGARLSPFALEAAVAEVRVEFTASARWLLALADAGVSRRVIDLIVALDFPDRFVVTRARPGRPWTRAGLSISRTEPIVTAAHAPYDDLPRFYWFGDQFWYGRGFVDCEPAPPIRPGEPVTHGRLVNGLGYVQVERRGAESAGNWSETSDGDGGISKDSLGASATSQGYTGGAAGSGTQTAQSRPPH